MKKISLSIILITVFLSCSTDFDVNADWEDISIVYSLLNQNDSVNYVKVNKAFLGNQDAYVMASQNDSTKYNSDISVTLERWEMDENFASQIIYLEKTTDIIKDSLDIYGNTGTFATENNIIYKTTEQLYSDSEYKLVVKIPKKEELVTSSTELISNFNPSVPQRFISFENYDSKLFVEWSSAVNGRLYKLKIRFHYLEIENNDTTEKAIDWIFPSQISRNLRGVGDVADEMTQSLRGESFFEFIAQNIDENPNVMRVAQNIDFIFEVGGEELSTYIQISKPANSISESKPEYTNINNGIGIFSCRYNKTIPDKKLSPRTIDSIAYGSYTNKLRFLNHSFLFK